MFQDGYINGIIALFYKANLILRNILLVKIIF